MTLERSRQRLNAWRRLNALRKFRASEVILEAVKDWLDKEITELEEFLKIRPMKLNRKMTTFRDAAIQRHKQIYKFRVTRRS